MSKRAVAIVAATVVMGIMAIVGARSAEACSPAPTCGDSFCYDAPTALVEATVVAWQTDSFTSEVTLSVTTVHGDAPELSPDVDTVLPSPNWTFSSYDIGKTRYVYLERNGAQELRVTRAIDPAAYDAVECFGPDATSATVAEVVMSTSCYATLVPEPPRGPACPEPVFGCSAAGAGAGAPGIGVLGGLLLRRRRAGLRRDTGARGNAR